MEDIFLRICEDAKFELRVSEDPPTIEEVRQQMKDLIQEMCDKLQDKTLILPQQGNVEVSGIFLNDLKGRLNLEEQLANNPQLSKAVGIVLRGVQRCRDSAANQMPRNVFESFLNFDSFCNSGFAVPVQGLFARLNTLEDNVKDVDTRLKDLDAKVDTRLKDLDAKVDTRFNNLDAKLDTELGELKTLIEAKNGKRKRTQARVQAARLRKVVASTPMRSSSSSSSAPAASTGAQESANKRTRTK
eukprot:gene13433-9621_t